MILTKVSDKKSANDFLKVPKQFYRKDNAWVCPLDRDINRIFDPGYNPMFKEGEAVRWVLKSEGGVLIGRIAAFYNLKKAKASGQLIGGAGFFEVIDDIVELPNGWNVEKGDIVTANTHIQMNFDEVTWKTDNDSFWHWFNRVMIEGHSDYFVKMGEKENV